jgi:hypothetical protein
VTKRKERKDKVTKISIFRTSFLWVETVPGILAGPPDGAPYGFLGQYGGYAQVFNDCQSRRATVPLTLPWDTPRGNFYWRYYFEGKHAGDMTGAQAWKKFVPFRLTLPSKIVTANAEAKVEFEGFYAPQGIAVVAQVKYRGEPKSPRDIAKLAFAVRYDYRFEIVGSAGPAAGVNLAEAANRAFALLRARGFGTIDGVAGDNQPFSVTTFLVGEDLATPDEGSDEHFMLEAMTSWNRNLKPSDLAKRPLADAQLPIRGAGPDTMMYARKQGRAIWMGHAFAGNPDTPLLACYHQNVTQASLQTLSLGEFVSWIAGKHNAKTPIAPALDERAKRAATLLELFSDGQTGMGRKVTYRTASVSAQIKQADWANAIALVKALP